MSVVTLLTSPQQLEILDLRHFNARQLRPLLNEEAEVWNKRLRWDYRTSTNLLLEYLDNRILPGFVALARGKIVGYTFSVYEGQKAVIGDIYAAAANPAPLAVSHTLVRHLLETLKAAPDVDRIESQLLLFDAGVLSPAFAGFRVFPRLFLERLLLFEPGPLPTFAPEYLLERWVPAHYNAVGELILAAYVGHVDSEINDQYRTLAGALRFLHNVVRFPGCGTFDPECSWVLRHRGSSGTLAGALLCSRVAPDTAHVTQLCIDPAARGQGLGKQLLQLCLSQLAARQYRALSLTVTEANATALGLYLRAGFRTRQRFDAIVHDKLPRLPGSPRLLP